MAVKSRRSRKAPPLNLYGEPVIRLNAASLVTAPPQINEWRETEMAKIKYGQGEIISEYPTGIRLIKFRGRYYTAYGRMFVVAGNHVNTDYDKVCTMKHYNFCDWSQLTDMYVDE
jgi:hypothetical protein